MQLRLALLGQFPLLLRQLLERLQVRPLLACHGREQPGPLRLGLRLEVVSQVLAEGAQRLEAVAQELGRGARCGAHNGRLGGAAAAHGGQGQTTVLVWSLDADRRRAIEDESKRASGRSWTVMKRHEPRSAHAVHVAQRGPWLLERAAHGRRDLGMEVLHLAPMQLEHARSHVRRTLLPALIHLPPR